MCICNDENIFEDRVARVLGQLGVPTAADVNKLSERVQILSHKVTELTKPQKAAKPRKTTAKKPAAKPAAKKPAAKKAPAKKRTPRLQMIVAQGSQDSPDLYGNIDITSTEAIAGTHKMVTIPWGFYKPLYKVKIPPGVKHGTKLRLSRMGGALAMRQ